MKTATLRKKKFNIKTKNVFIFSAITTLGLLGSCTTKPAVVKGTKTISAENIAMGKTVFENSCAKCHDLPSPSEHSAQDWVGIMNRMAPKAKLTDAQHDMVYNYIASEIK